MTVCLPGSSWAKWCYKNRPETLDKLNLRHVPLQPSELQRPRHTALRLCNSSLPHLLDLRVPSSIRSRMLRASWLVVRQARHLQTCSSALRCSAQGQTSAANPPLAYAALYNAYDNFDCSSRGFAAAAEPAEERVQLSARVTGLAGKYAAALYSAGFKAKALDQIESDLIEIWNTAARSKEFRTFLKDPSIPKGEKEDGLQSVLKDLKVSEITQRFMGVLAENNRLAEIIRICNSFDDLMSAARGEVTATITTAAELSRKEVDEIKTGLNQILEKGQKLILQEQINPSIIGGIVIDVGDKHIDLSISSRVKRVQQLILETV